MTDPIVIAKRDAAKQWVDAVNADPNVPDQLGLPAPIRRVHQERTQLGRAQSRRTSARLMMRVRDLGPDPSPDALTNRLREIRSDVNRWQQWYADNSGPAVQEVVLSGRTTCSRSLTSVLT